MQYHRGRDDICDLSFPDFYDLTVTGMKILLTREAISPAGNISFMRRASVSFSCIVLLRNDACNVSAMTIHIDMKVLVLLYIGE
jgi:hypothetical protein